MNAVQEKRLHYYAPFLGQPSGTDFVSFHRASVTAFEDHLPPLYVDPHVTPGKKR